MRYLIDHIIGHMRTTFISYCSSAGSGVAFCQQVYWFQLIYNAVAFHATLKVDLSVLAAAVLVQGNLVVRTSESIERTRF